MCSLCLGIKRSTKLQISKSTPNGDILFKIKPLFKNYNERLVWTTKLFSCICDITNCKSRLLKFELLAGECLVELCTFQNRNPVQVFLYHCIFDGNQLFSENLGCHFPLILHMMSDKAAFVSRFVLCIALKQGNLELSRYNNASCWQKIHLHIYVATNSVSMWDYGINKLNCITVSVQFML